MIRVGLTGNRYSGKDKVAKMFEQISVPVFHADIVLKFILQFNSDIDKEIKIQLGQSVYGVGGQLDPNKFDTTEKFNRLMDIVEPELMKSYERFLLKNKMGIYTIFHSSILFERDLESKMDINISVFSPRNDRIERVKSEEPALLISVVDKLMSSEIDDLDKNKKSTYIIHNYDDAIDVIKQVDGIDQQIIDKFLKDEQTKKVPDNKIIHKHLNLYPL